MSKHEVIGLIAGNGKFPFLFARQARKKNYQIVAVGIKRDTAFLLKYFVDRLEWVGPGELKKMFSFFKKEGVCNVVMAGQVTPANLFDKNVVIDAEFQELFKSMEDRKADTIFSAVANRLKREGMILQDSTFLVKEYLAPKGTITKRGPSEQELEDIAFGSEIAKSMGSIDVGQTVVVKGKAILAIEAMEGTDRAIVRGGKIAQQGAVVVKVSKPEQDNRFDVPVVGPRTIEAMRTSKASCLAIESGRTLIIDREKTVRLANKSNISIVSI